MINPLIPGLVLKLILYKLYSDSLLMREWATTHPLRECVELIVTRLESDGVLIFIPVNSEVHSPSPRLVCLRHSALVVVGNSNWCFSRVLSSGFLSMKRRSEYLLIDYNVFSVVGDMIEENTCITELSSIHFVSAIPIVFVNDKDACENGDADNKKQNR